LLTLLALGCASTQRPAPTRSADPSVAFAGPVLEPAEPPSPGAESPELAVMAEELAAAMRALSAQPDAAPYFVSYLLSDVDSTRIGAQHGAIETSYEKRYRVLDVDLRVGSPELDNTHPVRGFPSSLVDHQAYRVEVPLGADPIALRTALWSETDVAYKRGLERLAQVKAERAIKADEEDPSGDFSAHAQVTRIEPKVTSVLDRTRWETRLRKLSAIFAEYPVPCSGPTISSLRFRFRPSTRPVG
jgi:hypothetical protein